MKNKILSLSIMVCMMMGLLSANVITASAYGETQYGYLYYTESNGKITITDCDRNTESVEIPTEINGYPVTSIGDSAFFGCDLTSVTIPDSVISVGDAAFQRCGNLESVTIGKGVTIIGECPFVWWESLKNISVNGDNTNYCSVDGNLFNKDKTQLIQYAISKEDTEYIIPDSIITIDAFAFFHCDSLTSVTISDSVTDIGRCAFSECISLKKI